ncbi:Cytochrome c1 heme lyase [Rhodotorula kratochvilovae]
MWPFSSTPTAQDPPPASACPVDHDTRSKWLDEQSTAALPQKHSFPARGADHDPHAHLLSTEREVSSIPRWLPSSSSSSSSSTAPPPEPAPASAHADVPPSACPMHESERAAALPNEENWVYPSPASFYSALQRKERNPQARDMGIVVPIHNAVNERVWNQVLDWEREAMGLKPGEETGSKLVSFVGKPKEVSPRARWKSLIGYTAPFDRHDWLVDRPLHPPSSASSSSPSSSPSDTPESVRIRYVIDFYTGRGAGLLTPPPPAGTPPAPEENFRPNLAFFIDCRPALDGWEGVRMRFNRYWGLGADAAKEAGK